HENSRAAQAHVFGLAFFQDDEVERLVKLKGTVLAMSAVRFQIIDFGKYPPQSANVNGLAGDLAFAHEEGEQGKNFLSAPQGEAGHEHASFTSEDLIDGRGQPVNF